MVGVREVHEHNLFQIVGSTINQTMQPNFRNKVWRRTYLKMSDILDFRRSYAIENAVLQLDYRSTYGNSLFNL